MNPNKISLNDQHNYGSKPPKLIRLASSTLSQFDDDQPNSPQNPPLSPNKNTEENDNEEYEHSDGIEILDKEDLEPPPHLLREQDRFLPIANIGRIMKRSTPENSKIAKGTKECMQECVSEFLSFITSEASDKCIDEKRRTISGEDILWALQNLGFEPYVEPLKIYLSKYRSASRSEKGVLLSTQDDFATVDYQQGSSQGINDPNLVNNLLQVLQNDKFSARLDNTSSATSSFSSDVGEGTVLTGAQLASMLQSGQLILTPVETPTLQNSDSLAANFDRQNPRKSGQSSSFIGNVVQMSGTNSANNNRNSTVQLVQIVNQSPTVATTLSSTVTKQIDRMKKL